MTIIRITLVFLVFVVVDRTRAWSGTLQETDVVCDAAHGALCAFALDTDRPWDSPITVRLQPGKHTLVVNGASLRLHPFTPVLKNVVSRAYWHGENEEDACLTARCVNERGLCELVGLWDHASAASVAVFMSRNGTVQHAVSDHYDGPDPAYKVVRRANAWTTVCFDPAFSIIVYALGAELVYDASVAIRYSARPLPMRVIPGTRKKIAGLGEFEVGLDLAIQVRTTLGKMLEKFGGEKDALVISAY